MTDSGHERNGIFREIHKNVLSIKIQKYCTIKIFYNSEISSLPTPGSCKTNDIKK